MRIVLILFGVLIFFSMQQACLASEASIDINIDHASYHDLDSDSLSDDIQITLTCCVKCGTKSPAKTEYLITLTLPSGTMHLVSIKLIGKYNIIHMNLDWFDVATEPGWYNVKVDALTFGGSHWGHTSTNYNFDPPTGSGGGEPHVAISIW